MTGDRATRAVGVGLATVLLVVIAVVDVLVDDPVVLSPLFSLAPLVACAVLPAPATAVYGLAAVALTVAAGWWNDVLDEPQQTVRVVYVALIAAAAVAISIVRVRREHRYARMAEIAEVAQRTILPTLPEMVGRVALGARYLSAAQEAVVGGDLYDCYHSDTHVRLLVGDVRGKGIGAVEQAARVIRAFRQAAATQPDLPAVASHMSRYLAPFFDEEEFVTALLVDVSDPLRLTLVSCGHPPPVHVQPDGHASFREAPADLPLGLGDVYRSLDLRWDPGDRLLIYTDGLSEARDRRGRFLPLLPLAPLLAAGTVDAALEHVLDTVRGHVPNAELSDDLAVMLVEHLSVEDLSDPRLTDALGESAPASHGLTGAAASPGGPPGELENQSSEGATSALLRHCRRRRVGRRQDRRRCRPPIVRGR
jgi:phosphoserine phosphatase RsbU/P